MTTAPKITSNSWRRSLQTKAVPERNSVIYLAFADNTAAVVGMTVVVLAAEDMADRAVNLLADMAFVAFADIAVVAVDKDPVVDTAVGMVDADHTA